MEIKIFSDPKAFLKATENFLLEKEAQNNLPLGVIGELIRDPVPNDYLLATVEKDNKPVLVLIKNVGPLIISGEEEHLSQGVEIFANFANLENISIPGLFGPREQVKAFIGSWKKIFPVSWQEIMEQRIFRLDQPQIEPASPEKLRPAVEKDIEQVTEWVELFSKEADPGGEIPPALAREKAEGGIKQREFFLWEEEKPVAMAKKARPTPNGVAITMVYTPQEYRKKGYATGCVSALSQKLLEEGFSFCTLFTDAKNPTSNKIYEEIGFREVGSALIGKFSETD